MSSTPHARTSPPSPANGAPVEVHIPPSRRARHSDLRRALALFQQLMERPDDTGLAMEITLCLDGGRFERGFQRFAALPAGRRLLAERPDLCAALSDRDALAAMGEASFGRAVLLYLEENGYAARELLALQHETERRWMQATGEPPLDPLRRWVSDRMLLSHDLFHVLTGYPTDGVGEATLLAFSLAQQGGRAGTLLTLGAALELLPKLGVDWLRYDWRAWQRGRRARWLAAQPWEELLPLRLDTVREMLEIEPAAVAHPRGIRFDPPAPAAPPVQ